MPTQIDRSAVPDNRPTSEEISRAAGQEKSWIPPLTWLSSSGWFLAWWSPHLAFVGKHPWIVCSRPSLLVTTEKLFDYRNSQDGQLPNEPHCNNAQNYGTSDCGRCYGSFSETNSLILTTAYFERCPAPVAWLIGWTLSLRPWTLDGQLCYSFQTRQIILTVPNEMELYSIFDQILWWPSSSLSFRNQVTVAHGFQFELRLVTGGVI